MNKDEFLRELQESLTGEISDQEIQENLSYYNSYITEEIQKGKSEQEVLTSLGSPRLIARSIIDAALEEKEGAGHYFSRFDEKEVTYDENDNREHPEIEERKQNIARIFRTVVTGILIVAVIAVALKAFVALLPLICVLVVVGIIWRRLQ